NQKWYMELLRAILDERARQIIKETTACKRVDDEETLKKAGREALLSPTILGPFINICKGGLKASELVKLGNYDSVSSLMRDDLFPLDPHQPLIRVIELVKFAHSLTSEEVLSELERLGLNRPTPQDALFFGINHPEEQMKSPIVFLHEPVEAPPGRFSVFVLYAVDGKRYLGLDWLSIKWGQICLFAGVRQ
ncbi:MAG: hypothetical protein QME65_06580, partial [Candidatus Omnitrophota bacterium]|nr:hypothetical protein [Candidatus Omnitrophota bacterium]